MTTPKEALERIKSLVVGDKIPNWRDDFTTTNTRGHIADLCDTALASLQGEDAVERVSRLIEEHVTAHCDDERCQTWLDNTRDAAEAILATGLVPDEAAIRADSKANLISIIADIREKTGLGGKPMLNELADAIAAEMDRRVANEREKMLDKVCENLIVLSRGDESIIGAARVALNNAAVFICGADRAKRAIRSGGGE